MPKTSEYSGKFWERRFLVLALLGIFAFLFCFVHTAEAKVQKTVDGLEITEEVQGSFSTANFTSNPWVYCYANKDKNNVHYAGGTYTVRLKNNSGVTEHVSYQYTYKLNVDGVKIEINPAPDGIPNGVVQNKKTLANKTPSGDIVLAPNEEITVKITLPDTTAYRQGKFGMEDLTVVKEQVRLVTFFPAEGCSYSVTRNAAPVEINDSNGVSVATDATYSVSMTMNSGYILVGWDGKDENETAVAVSGPHHETTSGQLVMPENCASVRPLVFRADDMPFKVDGRKYPTWETAFSAAAVLQKNEKIVQLTKDYTLPSTLAENKVGEPDGGVYVKPMTDGLKYIIPQGFELLLPRNQENPGICMSSGFMGSPNVEAGTGRADLDPNAGLVLTLTVPQGMEIENAGTLDVGGTAAENGGNRGSHANIVLNGRIVNRNTGVLTAFGYIVGDGTVVAQKYAKLYQPLCIVDYRGGGYTTGAAGGDYAVGTQTGETYVSPFLIYTGTAFRCNVEMQTYSYMYGYCCLAAGGSFNCTTSLLVGFKELKNSNVNEQLGIITLEDGATLCQSYNENVSVTCTLVNSSSLPSVSVGRTEITITGKSTDDPAAYYGSLDISAVGQNLQSSSLSFPVPFNYDIALTKGQYEISHSVLFLPGSELTVSDDAVLNIGSEAANNMRFLIMDGLYDHKTSSSTGSVTVAHGTLSSAHYPAVSDLETFQGGKTANLVVDGTLNVGTGVDFGGLVQTNGGGVINTDNASHMSCKAQVGLVGEKAIMGTTYRFAGATVRESAARIWDGASIINMEAGKTYDGLADSAGTIANYTYTLYTHSANIATYQNFTDNLNAPIAGKWHDHNAQPPISVTVEWGNEPWSFEYIEDSVYTWNPEILKYTVERSGSWSGEKTIVITSNAPYELTAEITFTKNNTETADWNVPPSMTFTKEGESTPAETFPVPGKTGGADGSVTVDAMLSGDPPPGTSFAGKNIGTVTVTITENP